MGAVSNKRATLVDTYRDLIAQAIKAVETRMSWSPYKDSPSSKIHGTEKPAAGKAAFDARLNKKFELDLPGITGWVGEEVSPLTLEPLGIQYPTTDPETLIAAAKKGMPEWAKADPELRISLCAAMADRLYDRNFEMAHAIMHVAGQSYTQASVAQGRTHLIAVLRRWPTLQLRCVMSRPRQPTIAISPETR